MYLSSFCATSRDNCKWFCVVGGVSGGEAAVVSSVEAEEDGLLVASC